ncbi:hypothetical protein SO802_016729 [Lithocarpus litseifolius]|uniref:CDP-diacylglycerol--glycerol-3-phosphate 1-phosphatidyltransferase n=1 Tax=Lithocarpus litseifolius TaxID=425828 RepID=A0AAW2CZV4_9ROSI
MSRIKLPMTAASIYTHSHGHGHGHGHQWVAATTTTAGTATKLVIKPKPKPKPFITLYNRVPPAVIYKRGEWRIVPCAPHIPSAHVNNPPKTIGFRVLHNKCFFPFSFSSERKGGRVFSSSGSESGSGSSGSGLAVDMGAENKDNNDLLQQQQQQHHTSKFLTLPTVLTLGRVAAVPLLISTFYVDSWWGTTATTSIFVAAAVTDWLDGYLARKMRLGSAFGAFLDPVADKLMVAATLVLLCSRPQEIAMFEQVPWFLTAPSIAIIGREITMSAVREWAASQNSKLLEAVAVNNLGKWKTATQMTALTILLATRDTSLGGPGILVASGVVLLYISAGLALWSLVVYMRKIWRVLLR